MPFKIKSLVGGGEKEMKFEAGIFGCDQNEKKEVSLAIGWLVSHYNSPNKVNEDIEFENLKKKRGRQVWL